MTRTKSIAFLSETALDVLVIGGGIVGSSIARDAAMRGLRTGLVEQRDFASGTSSRSSRLLHGGIRYLAQGRLGLVHEASVEKTVLHRIAPHLAAPMPFIFPTWRQNPKWKLWQLKIGVKLYDLLCGGRNLGASSWLSARETAALVPGLRCQGLNGAVRYYDGFTNDARLVLDTLRSACESGADVFNYARFVSADRQEFWQCLIKDEVTGDEVRVRTRTVVNATGPWAQGLPHSAVKLRLTKGIHLVIDHARLPVSETVVMADGSRILFAIPWADRTIIGTTDTDHDGAPGDVTADTEDVNYVLRIANAHFPEALLCHSDIISTWAGLRPLIADPRGRPSDISRNHEIKSPEPGWWDVAGGKLTTCRLMAEQTVDRIVQATGLRAQPCSTGDVPLLQEPGLSGIAPPPVTSEAVHHFCEHEWARHLDDVMIRRAGWHYHHREAAEIAAEVSGWMAGAMNWDAAMQDDELRRYLAIQRVPAAG